MRSSHMQKGGFCSGKTALLLCTGGTILTAAAALAIFLRSTEPSSPPLPSVSPKEEKTLLSPLVPLTPPKPPPAEDSDSREEAPIRTEAAKTPRYKKTKKKQRIEEPTGTVDAQAVNAYINARFSRVRSCYERRLKAKPFLEGRLDLNIFVSPTGKVSTITVNSDTVRDAEMLSCVKSVVRAWNFPKPNGGRVVIAKTFNFKKRE